MLGESLRLLYAYVLDKAVFLPQLQDAVVANLSNPLRWIPPASCSSQRVLQLRSLPPAPHSGDRGARRPPAPGLPVCLFDIEPLADLLVVTIAHTYQSFPVLVEQPLCSF